MQHNYILIAEDDEDDQFLLKTAFTELVPGVELFFVSNGLDILNHFKKFESGSIKYLPSLLIVDLNMPKKNGSEAIKELVTKSYFKNFHTLVFSTTGSELERKRCSEIGIKEFFVKPSSYNELLNLVKQFGELAMAKNPLSF